VANLRGSQNKSFDKALLSFAEGFRANAKRLIPFLVSLSNHERNQANQRFLNQRGQGGFSLLEVLVAFSILALSLGVLLRIFSGDGRLAGLAEEHTRAVVLAESLLAQTGVETPLQLGQFAGKDGPYDWTMRVTLFMPVMPDGQPLPEQLAFKPYWVDVTVTWGEQAELRTFSLGTLRLVGEARVDGNNGIPKFPTRR
jgi:general secretion pathway protein I